MRTFCYPHTSREFSACDADLYTLIKFFTAEESECVCGGGGGTVVPEADSCRAPFLSKNLDSIPISASHLEGTGFDTQ